MKDQTRPIAAAVVTDRENVLLLKPKSNTTKDWILPYERIRENENGENALYRKFENGFGIDILQLSPIKTINSEDMIGENGNFIVLYKVLLNSLEDAGVDDGLQSKFECVSGSNINSYNIPNRIRNLIIQSMEQLHTNSISNRVPSDEELVAIAQKAAQNTVKPSSKDSNAVRTRVGAAVMTSEYQVFTGTLIETRDKIQTLHAEQLAIAKAISNGCDLIKKVVVYANSEDIWPCGVCLQFIYEFSNGENVSIISADNSGINGHKSLNELYNQPWPPDLHD